MLRGRLPADTRKNRVQVGGLPAPLAPQVLVRPPRPAQMALHLDRWRRIKVPFFAFPAERIGHRPGQRQGRRAGAGRKSEIGSMGIPKHANIRTYVRICQGVQVRLPSSLRTRKSRGYVPLYPFAKRVCSFAKNDNVSGSRIFRMDWKQAGGSRGFRSSLRTEPGAAKAASQYVEASAGLRFASPEGF